MCVARTFGKVQLGLRLRALRVGPDEENPRVSAREALAAIDKGHLQPDTLRKAETGERFFSKLEVTTLARFYGAPEEEVQQIRQLWDLASEPSAFSSYGLPESVISYLDMEHAASAIHTVNSLLVPGIMQIPSYAQRVFELGDVDAAGEVDQRVAARAKRQERLRRSADNPNPLQLVTVIDEKVVRDCAREPRGAEQLSALVELANLDNVEILIIGPGNVGLHEGLLGNFHLLKFPTIDDLVYLETAGGGQTIDEHTMVERLSRRFDRLRSQALEATESLALIAELIN
jgi:Domain of unknown function (DUF5753)